MPIGVSNGHPQYSGKQNGAFIPEVWAGKLLKKYYNSTVFGAITNTDYEGMIANKGDTVIVRQRPDLTVTPYTKGVDLVYEAPTSVEKEFTIDYANYFAFEVKDVDDVQSDIALMDEFTTDASTQLKLAVDSQLLAQIPSQAHAQNSGATAGKISGNINLGTDAAPVGVTKDNILDLILDFGLCLDEQNVPETGRWVVLPAWAVSLIKRSDLKDASLTGDGTTPLRNGRVGIIDRFTIYSSNQVNAAAGKFDIIAGHNDATSFASQINKMETLRNQKDFGDYVRGLQVFGFKVMKPEALCHAVIQRG
ncbi:hypothetical protein [Photobacterium halotolerans]|uniref:phage major capsid protein n=1 Tax=Photobacterium halotolerans TaxID=265726 RepID=UPI000415FFF9|nr:hypothetical protein [Photobacterium halotolerans]